MDAQHLAVAPQQLSRNATHLSASSDALLSHMPGLKASASAASGTPADDACGELASRLVTVTRRCAEALERRAAALDTASWSYRDTEANAITGA